jgi:hypothetical protein
MNFKIPTKNGEHVMEMIKNFLYLSNKIVIPLALLFNLLSIITCRKNILSKTTNIWLHYTLVSATNIIIIVLGALQYASIDNDYNILISSGFSCVFVSFITRVFLQFSSWLNVTITFENMLLVRKQQLHKKYLSKKQNIILLITILFLILCLMNSLNLKLELVVVKKIALNVTLQIIITSEIESITNVTSTLSTLCTTDQRIIFFRDSIAQTFRLFIPFFLMVIGNFLLVQKLKRSKLKSCRVEGKSKKELKFIYAILALNILFFVSLVPTTITTILLNIHNYGDSNTFESKSLEIAYIKFANIISAVIATYNYVFPFLINLKFNRLFYEEFMHIFCKILPKPRYLKPKNISTINQTKRVSTES